MPDIPPEPIWNGLITCDYEESRPNATALAWELSTRSVTSWPSVLLDDTSPYGVLRRPGIVDVPEPEHQRLLTLWHQRLADPCFVTELRTRTETDRQATQAALLDCAHAAESGDRTDLAAALALATRALLKVSATHIVNWLLPESHWQQLLTDLLGDGHKAEECMLALQLPDRPGVILASTSDADTQRRASVEARDTWLATLSNTAELRAGRDSDLFAEVTALGLALSWAAECEERRHELRAIYLAHVDAWCRATGADPRTITIDDLAGAPIRAVPLKQATDLALHGGKAVQLAQLLAAGLPVADGLVIPADLPEDDVGDAIHTILAWPGAHTDTGLICRSSAPGEDGPDASFAGLYASDFTPATPLSLLSALTAVRASATTGAVRAYAHAHDLPAPGQIAVVVQPALRPYAAGVLAAHLDPAPPDSPGKISLTRWRIEAVHGLAGPLVDGTVTGEVHHNGGPPHPAVQPDLLLSATATELTLPPGEWVPVPQRDGTTTPMKIRTSGGGLLQLRVSGTHTAVLNPDDVDRLLALATTAAHTLRLHRIDMEWVMANDGTLTIVQARFLTRPLPDQHDAQPYQNGTWQGIAASGGHATGRALLLHPQLQPGDLAGAVLLCDNLGGDVLAALSHAPAAIAATRGGPLSHAATLARELGIPCVTALPAQLPHAINGARVIVDGDAGTLHLIDAPTSGRP